MSRLDEICEKVAIARDQNGPKPSPLLDDFDWLLAEVERLTGELAAAEQTIADIGEGIARAIVEADP